MTSTVAFLHPKGLNPSSRHPVDSSEGGENLLVLFEKEEEADSKKPAGAIRKYTSWSSSLPLARSIYREIVTMSLMQESKYAPRIDNIYLSPDNKDLYVVHSSLAIASNLLPPTSGDQKPDHENIKSIGFQLLSALNHLHRRGIVHKHLSPKTISSIVDGSSGLLNLADYGCVREVDCDNLAKDPDRDRFRVRSPEMLLNFKQIDGRADCWSAGCLLADLYLRHKGRFALAPTRQDNSAMFFVFFDTLGFPNFDFVQEHALNGAASYQFLDILREKFSDLPRTRAGKGEAETPRLRDQLKQAGVPPDAIAVIDGLLQFDFQKRLTAEQALIQWFGADAIKDAPVNDRRPNPFYPEAATLNIKTKLYESANSEIRAIQNMELPKIVEGLEKKKKADEFVVSKISRINS